MPDPDDTNPARGPQRVVVLDDYQGVARRYGDWATLGDRVDLVVHEEHLADEDALVAALSGAPIVVAMRERTAFPRSLLERLEDLRLLVTTGPRNAAIDMAACHDLGVTVPVPGVGEVTPTLGTAVPLELACP